MSVWWHENECQICPDSFTDLTHNRSAHTQTHTYTLTLLSKHITRWLLPLTHLFPLTGLLREKPVQFWIDNATSFLSWSPKHNRYRIYNKCFICSLLLKQNSGFVQLIFVTWTVLIVSNNDIIVNCWDLETLRHPWEEVQQGRNRNTSSQTSRRVVNKPLGKPHLEKITKGIVKLQFTDKVLGSVSTYCACYCRSHTVFPV